MRLDKYLKVSRIIKRRTIAKECVDRGLVTLNSKTAKASTEVKIGDILEVKIKNKLSTYRVEAVLEYATEEKAKTMYSLIEEKDL